MGLPSPEPDPSRHDLFITDLLDPVWNRDSSHMTHFPCQHTARALPHLSREREAKDHS